MMARVSRNPNSSPTIAAINQFRKGTTAIIHQMALLRTENGVLREANEALSKRRRAKKTRVQQGGSLTAQEKQDREDQQAIEKQLMQESRQGRGCAAGTRRLSDWAAFGQQVRETIQVRPVWPISNLRVLPNKGRDRSPAATAVLKVRRFMTTILSDLVREGLRIYTNSLI